MVETAQQTFAKTADKLKEMYADLLVIADHQFKQIEDANKILENLAKEAHPKNYVLAYQHLQHVLKIPRSDEQKLTCDKTREPPCHLEPSPELCAKCELNNCENKEQVKP